MHEQTTENRWAILGLDIEIGSVKRWLRDNPNAYPEFRIDMQKKLQELENKLEQLKSENK